MRAFTREEQINAQDVKRPDSWLGVGMEGKPQQSPGSGHLEGGE